MNPGATPEKHLAPGKGGGAQPTPRSVTAAYVLLGALLLLGALCYAGIAWTL